MWLFVLLNFIILVFSCDQSFLFFKMRISSGPHSSLLSLLILLLHSTMQATTAGSQFSSHITVNTPAKSFSHGVGDPIPPGGRRWSQKQTPRGSFKSLRNSPSISRNGGYPRTRPSIPFNGEERAHSTSYQVAPWVQNNFNEFSLPVLPPSPYKVDSPDPESLWPEGLFVPPYGPPRFGSTLGRRADDGEVASEQTPLDPYLLEGSEAIAAIERSQSHGHLYFHDIPHIDSLLANQELRLQNQLKPHRIASLRHTWPYFRP